jgi:ElaB/YqjD/DUF883 family membrane-anchored ribosome-binding protein
MAHSTREIAALKKQMKEMAARLAELTEDTMYDASEQAHDYVNDARENIGEWADIFRDHSVDVSKRAKRMAKDTKEYVNENPWAVAGGALALGILAGLFMRNKD